MKYFRPSLLTRTQRSVGGKSARRKDEDLAKLVMIWPGTLVILLIISFPVIYVLYLGLHDWSGSLVKPPVFIGLANYQALFRDDRFINAIMRTLLFTVAAVAIELILGVALAVFLNREFYGKNFMRTLFLLPFMATPVVIGLTWLMMYNPAIGVFNYILQSLKLPISTWSYSTRTALASLVVIDIWQYTPMVMLIVMAALSALPQEPIEAAIVDGANALQAFWYITLPLLRPAIVIALLFRTIDTLKVFDIIYALTQGGPAFATETLNIYAFLTNFQYLRFGYGSAVFFLFVMLMLSICVILIRLRRGVEAEQ
jgi:multiple sugar transport system permease protein